VLDQIEMERGAGRGNAEGRNEGGGRRREGERWTKGEEVGERGGRGGWVVRMSGHGR